MVDYMYSYSILSVYVARPDAGRRYFICAYCRRFASYLESPRATSSRSLGSGGRAAITSHCQPTLCSQHSTAVPRHETHLSAHSPSRVAHGRHRLSSS